MPGKGMSFGDLFQSIRRLGLENTLNRWYSVYPAKIEDSADPSQQGKTKPNIPFLGFPEAHPRFSYPVSPYAGRNHGFYFPQHDDESAWVVFDQGDTNSARVVGGWWGNSGDQDPKQPENSYVPPEFVRKDGSAPTGRGIKIREGHFLAFDGDPENYYVEFTTATNETETVESTDAQGNVTTREVTKIGVRAEKHHRLRMDDTAEQTVLATFGDENPNAEEIGENDANQEVDRKELTSRLRHWLLMRDKSDDRFVQLKSIGDDDTLFHQFLMSDTDEQVLIKTTKEHFWEINDKDEFSTWEMADGFIVKLDQKNQVITGETPDGRRIILDDNNAEAILETFDHTLTFSSNNGTTLEDTTGMPMQISTAGDLNVEAQGNHTFDVTGNSDNTITGNETVTISGNQDVTVTGNMTFNVSGTIQKMMAALQIMASGSITINAPQITMTSTQVTIGSGAIQRLCNEVFLATFNSHFHISANPGAPTLSASGSGFVAVPGVHTTLFTSAG